jgi:hypothetical protein
MTIRGTLGLLALLGVLLFYMAVIDRPSVPTASLAPPLLTVPATEVTEVAVTWSDARVTAHRDGTRWRDPSGGAIPDGMIDDILQALRTVRPSSTLSADGADASAYGFGRPAISLRVAIAGAPPLQLDVGERNPAWTSIYVRRSGAPEVLVVGALLHWELEKLRAAAAR